MLDLHLRSKGIIPHFSKINPCTKESFKFVSFVETHQKITFNFASFVSSHQKITFTELLLISYF